MRRAEQDGQVVLCVFLADATVALVQYPVDWVPGAPVFEGGIQEQSGIGGKDGIQIRCRCFGGWCEPIIHCGLFVLVVWHRLCHLYVGREFTSVYERSRESTSIHGLPEQQFMGFA